MDQKVGSKPTPRSERKAEVLLLEQLEPKNLQRKKVQKP
jgi:hypothetical protein